MYSVLGHDAPRHHCAPEDRGWADDLDDHDAEKAKPAGTLHDPVHQVVPEETARVEGPIHVRAVSLRGRVLGVEEGVLQLQVSHACDAVDVAWEVIIGGDPI